MNERFVQAAQEDKRWTFHQEGEPLPEENIASYEARIKRNRLNEALMAQLLGRLGAFPWSDSFYAVPERPCFVLRRVRIPPAITRKSISEVVRGN
jgi:hypothetical protein